MSASAAASPYMARQGDVLLVEVSDLPAGCVVAQRRGDVILANGEATGHAHRIDSLWAALFRAPDGNIYLRAGESTALSHEEHDPIPVPPGTYRVVRQREYARHAEEESRAHESPWTWVED